MKRFRSLIAVLIVLCMLLSGCGGDDSAQSDQSQQDQTGESTTDQGSSGTVTEVDHAASIKLDMSSSTAKVTATVKAFIDGDTTHFNVPSSAMENGVLKARYMAINTPESTGKIEEYGKKASAFTKEKLSAATSIILESETSVWDPDSTGSRYLVWVWYRTDENSDYRNLNIEILQNGLAIANSSANNQYGTTCTEALNQAKALKLNVYSGQKDPDFYYGEAIELTLKELRTNIESYNGMKVAFNGIISSNSGSQGVYVEDYDSETDLYYGIYIYYGHNLTGAGLDVLAVGNEVRIVGTVQYYEGGGTWQVSDLNYRLMKPDDPNNIQKLSGGNTASYRLTDPNTFVNSTVTLQLKETELTAPYAKMALGTSVEMKNLQVVSAYTTTNEDSSSKGAMTLTCRAPDGTTIDVRTAVLLDENGQLITQDRYAGRTIDVKGIVDYFSGNYQIKVFTPDNITIIN